MNTKSNELSVLGLEKDAQEKNDIYEMQNNMDTLNMNNGYLLLILQAYETYVRLKLTGIGDKGKDCPDYYFLQFDNLHLIAELLSPKMPVADRDKILNHMEKVRPRLYEIYKSNGDTIRVNTQLKLTVDKIFSQYFQFVLSQMQERGMLTHIKIKAAAAGSQFEE